MQSHDPAFFSTAILQHIPPTHPSVVSVSLSLCFPVRWHFRCAPMVAPYSAAVICLCLRIHVCVCMLVCVWEKECSLMHDGASVQPDLCCVRSIASHTAFQKGRDFLWANLGHVKSTFSMCQIMCSQSGNKAIYNLFYTWVISFKKSEMLG